MSNKPTLYVSKRNEQIYQRVMAEVAATPGANFSDWVLEACRVRLEGRAGQINDDAIDRIVERVAELLSDFTPPSAAPPPTAKSGNDWFK